MLHSYAVKMGGSFCSTIESVAHHAQVVNEIVDLVDSKLNGDLLFRKTMMDAALWALTQRQQSCLWEVCHP